MKEFMQTHIFLCAVLFVGGLSLFLQAWMALSLKGYVKASANMKTTRKKVMINLKNQFEAIYGMDCQIRNSAAYVDKYLLKLRFMGMPYLVWEKIPFLTAGLVTLLTGAGIFYGYVHHVKMDAQVEILFAYSMVLACLFLFFHIFGIKSKKKQIQIQLVDYLENYLTNRLVRTKDSGNESNAGEKEQDLVQTKAATMKQEDERTDEEEMDEDTEKLKQLLQTAGKKKEMEQQIAVSKEEDEKRTEKKVSWAEEIEPDTETAEDEIELLEEFVQSFLA